MVAFRLVVACVLVVGCSHAEPFAPRAPAALPPFSTATPRQLTFNPGSDRMPSVANGLVVFSRTEPTRADGDQCVAELPTTGGTLRLLACAHGEVSDAVLDAWLWPAIAPDGSRLAYVLQQGQRRSDVPERRALVVAPTDSVEAAVTVATPGFPAPDGTLVNGFRKITWLDAVTLRFIGGLEVFDRTTGDTVFTPLGLFDVAIDGGTPEPVAGIDPPFAYAAGADGALWFVPVTDPVGVYRLPVGSTTPEPVTRFATITGTSDTVVSVTDFALVGTSVVASAVVFIPPSPEGGGGFYTALLVQDTAGPGPARVLWSAGRVGGLAAIENGRGVIVEITLDARPDLWLVDVP
jgi:hypothetical protein